MDAGLDTVEEDVERNRVGKNPFDQRFTALTESPFTETSTSTGQIGNGGHEIETISRHIIVRMEVIAKQIAFLSKETAGQPHKVLAGGGRVGASSSSATSAGRLQRNVSVEGAAERPLDTRAGNAKIGSRSGFNDIGTGVASGDSSSPFGAPLVARLDLYRKIRQGLATAEDLLPAGMLSAAPSGMASSRPTPLPATVTSLSSDGLASSTAPGILHGFIKHVKPFSVCYASAAQANGPPKENDDDMHKNAKSVSTFVEDEGHGDGNSNGGGDGNSDNGNGSGVAANFCYYGDDMPCSPYEATIGHATPTSSAGRSPTTTMAAAAAAATAGEGLTHTRAEKGGDSGDGSRSCEQGEEQERQHGAPRKPALPPAGGAEALRRAKARLQGKRKLSYPGFSSPIPENPITRLGYCEQAVGKDIAEGGRYRDGGLMSVEGVRGGGGGGGSSALHSSLRGTDTSTPSAATTVAAVARLRTSSGVAGTRGVGGFSRRKRNGNDSNTNDSNSCNSNNGERKGATGKKRRGAVVGGVHGGRNGGGGGAEPGWSVLSWGSAKQLRKQMEAAATAAGKTASEGKGGRRSKGRGGGGGGAASSKKNITLSDPVTGSGGGGAVSSIGPLGLVPCSNALRLEFPPAAEGLECYLVSLANPFRDLAAMKSAFEEEPQLSPEVSGGMVPFPEASPPLSALGGTPPSDGFDFVLGPDFQNETAVATAVVAAVDHIHEVGANVKADVPKGSTHPGSETPNPNTAGPRGGALRTVTAQQAPPPLPSPPVRPSDAAATANGLNPGGTCMIDLRNIWQRTGAVSRAISQARSGHTSPWNISTLADPNRLEAP
ncbi:hypothetical protein Esi_0110_0047 [Ectocarpus siliculosus]|uniref:Uncharacterized protein n=1 Tax=Ectocarpus siliculosus TaxID=2880 RepID=D7FHR6_ECTSI|nr:hypothetical protein Esi_0110_0047 [Ectocarpus siliculosus]|eukprot:CBJ28621.1 hypothetical protein Esi_0110_0047 [Ectocarpus siliculosus]